MLFKRFRKKILIGLAAVLCLSGCQTKEEIPDEPIHVSVWHVYGGQSDSPLNDMIDEFNADVGREMNIQVETKMISNTNNIHDDVLAAANNDPGAAKLPDIFISYPKTILAMPDSGILVDYREYFTEEELSFFIPEFLEEGIIEGKQLILPIAKSTEVLFVNKTIFDRFAESTGVNLHDLETWEGLFNTSIKYNEWTDSLTPDIEGDGKTFFVHDYHFDYFQVGVESLGERFFESGQIFFGPAFKRVWKPYAEAAIKGGIWLYEGYATDPLRIGDAVVSVASSASVLYYADKVTYPDNTSEDIEIIAMPCPVFEGGNNLVMQRGAGACVVKSTTEKEEAAVIFLKWLTESERNSKFVTEAGYMPVTEEAFEKYLLDEVEKLTEPKYKSLYKAFLETNEEYEFYTIPQLDTYLGIETAFEHNVRRILTKGFNEYMSSEEKNDEILNAITERCLDELASNF